MLAAIGRRGNLATGGTVTEYTVSGQKWRLHTFTSSDDFIVQRAAGPIRLAYVGGGGGGGANNDVNKGGGGDGGYGGDETGITLTVGTYPIVIGAGSSGAGNSVTALGRTGVGGGYGNDAGLSDEPAGTTRGPLSNIVDGVNNVQYGLGGPAGNPGWGPRAGDGAGGNGQFSGYPAGRIAAPGGAVWIAYPIPG